MEPHNLGQHRLEQQDHASAAALPLADGLLLDQFANDRNQDAFATLMQRHGPYVLGVCRRLTYHAQDAEDVFQACFLELARQARSIRQRNSVAGWLQTVAVRKARTARASRARRQQVEAAVRGKEGASNPDDITWREVRQALEEEVAQLPEDLRSPVILCLFREQTQEEAAQSLDVNLRTLRDRLQRGRTLLRNRLVRRGVTLSVLGALLSGGSVQAAVPAALTQATVHGAAALAGHAPLAGIVSPGALALTGSPALAGWGPLAALVAGLLLCAGAAYGLLVEPSPPPQRVVELAPAAGEAVPRPHRVVRTFRNGEFDDDFFEWSGPNHERYVRHEPEGLRITLPANDVQAKPIGVKVRYPVRGDFEVEATLEVLRLKGRFPLAGVTVYFRLKSAERDGVWLGRMLGRMEGHVFTAGHLTGAPADNKKRQARFHRDWSTDQAVGPARLRVVRQGPRFSFYAADGEAGAFRRLDSIDAGDAVVEMVRFAADPGWLSPIAGVDVRLLDFAMTAQEFVGYRADQAGRLSR
ncbi:MAG: sigma-70 family RNA polymerase sigma factor [Gemmataceae bacterium]|nr:sigma-70 family RNA polymerase sigma factor [Gemmataceae bacterium]